MGITSKITEGYKEHLSARAVARQRQRQRRPGTTAERASGDLFGIADNKRELAFAAVLVLLGIAALYPALNFGVNFSLDNKTNHKSNLKDLKIQTIQV